MEGRHLKVGCGEESADRIYCTWLFDRLPIEDDLNVIGHRARAEAAVARSDHALGTKAARTSPRPTDKGPAGLEQPVLQSLKATPGHKAPSGKGSRAHFVGLLQRRYAGKTDILVYNYVDDAVPVLLRMAVIQQVGYRALGHRYVVWPLGA